MAHQILRRRHRQRSTTVDKGDLHLRGRPRGLPRELVRRTAAGWPTRATSTNRDSAVFLYDTKDGKIAPGDVRLLQRPQPVVRPGRQVPLLPDRTARFQPLYGDIDTTWIYANTTIDRGRRRCATDVALAAAPRRTTRSKAKKDEREEDKATSGEKPTKGRTRTRRRKEREGERRRAAQAGRDRPRRLREPPRRAAARGGELSGPSLRVSGQGRSSAGCPNPGSAEKKRPGRSTTTSRSARRRPILDDADGFELSGRRQEDARGQDGRATRSSTSRDGPEDRQEDAVRPSSRRPSIRARSGGRSSTTPGGSSAISSTTRTCTASTGTAMQARYGKLLDDAVTREDVNYVHRRADRRAQLVAHLPRRRRHGVAAPSSASAISASTGRSRTAPIAIKKIIDGAPWDSEARSPLAQPGPESERGRLPARGQRRADGHRRRTRGRRSQGLADKTVDADRQRQAERARARARSLVETLDRRGPAPQPGLDRGQPQARRRGHRRPHRLYLRAQTPGIDGQNELVRQFHGADRQGRAGHRRAVQRRRADPRPVHRAAEPASR